MKCYLQFFSTSPISFLLLFESYSILFNASEGIQRYFSQYSIRSIKIHYIVITSNTYRKISGLPGMLLTLADVETYRKISIYGNRMEEYVDTMRNYVNKKKLYLLNLNINKYSDKKEEDGKEKDQSKLIIDTKELKIKSYSLVSNSKRSKYNSDTDNKCNSNDDNIVNSYLIEIIIPPKFDSIKAAKLIPKGPLYGKLFKGETVEYNGLTIKPEDVLLPPSSQYLLVIDIPDNSYFNSFSELLTSLCFQNIKPEMIVHLSPLDICNNIEYIKLISRFKNSKNITSKPDLNLFKSANQLHKQFRQIDKFIWSDLNYIDPEDIEVNNLFQVVPNMWIYNLAPTISIGEDLSQLVNESIYNVIDIPGLDSKINLINTEYQNNLLTLKNKQNKSVFENLVSSSSQFPKLSVFGTGCSKPSKYRNVSGLLIELSETMPHNILLDCGESTFDQFKLLKSASQLKSISVIVISHLHADHFLGLYTLIAERQKYSSTSVLIIAPPLIEKWLNECADLFGPISFKFNTCSHYENSVLLDDIQLRLQTIPVDHMQSELETAHGFIFEYLEIGFKFVYSGDCRPSVKLAEAGYGAALLIHEATFEDSCFKDACSKKHSTISEAVLVGENMNAGCTLLTHLSCKNPKVLNDSPDLTMAMDLMTLNMEKCLYLKKLTRQLQHVVEYLNVLKVVDSDE